MILILTSPLWFPMFGLVWISYKIEYVLDSLDYALQKMLDKIVR